MEEQLNYIIFNNLQLLENTEGHGIHTNQFVNSQNKPIKSPQHLIAFLEREHLIEQELGVEDKYFMTEFGFSVLDGDQVYVPNLYEDELVELVKSCGEVNDSSEGEPDYQSTIVRNDRITSMEENSGLQFQKIGVYIFIAFVIVYAGWKFMTLNAPEKDFQQTPQHASDTLDAKHDSL